MITAGDRLINEVNRSSQRWQKQGFQRRFSVTDLHGVEYQATMGKGVPAQFYTSISYDFDRFSHWWFKIIVNPYELKAITEGDGVDADVTVGFNGNGNYTGSPINYGGHTLSTEEIDGLTTACKEYGILPSGAICQLYLESNWGDSAVGRADNNWGGMTWTGSTNRPSGVTVSQGQPRAEGGFYNHYNTIGDFMKDYMYLLAKSTAGNNQKMYGVQGKTTIEDYTKGLFVEGGALYNYAEAGYSAYLPTMQSIYNGINQQNNDILKKIDDQVLNGQPSGSDDQEEEDDGGISIPKEENLPDTTKTKNALAEVDTLKGQTIGSGECYGLVAYYSMILGGPGLGGGVTGITGRVGEGMAAALIGTDYDWASYGWKAITPTSASELQPGSIVNIKANYGQPFLTGPFGHTAIVKSVSGDTIYIYEQNYAGKRFVVENAYNINDYLGGVQTVVYPPELVEGGVITSNGGTGGTSFSKVIKFPDDIKVEIDGIDFTPMFKAQFGGQWINKYAVFPNDKPNEGYDVMLAAAGLTEEQRKLIYTSGEHLVEISGSLQADVILRIYLKYNHLN